MSFHYHARRVRDPGRGPWRRLSSLRACVRSYCRLTRTSYPRMLVCLGLEIPWDPRSQPPLDEHMRRALDQVERARNRYLDRLRVLERRRACAKRRGNRQLSSAERAALRELQSGAAW